MNELNNINYTGIEEIKNGLFASSKFESKMYVGNRPHVVIFANAAPEPVKWGRPLIDVNRLHIVEIGLPQTPPASESDTELNNLGGTPTG